MPTSSALRIPGALLSALVFRYSVKLFEIDELRRKRRREHLHFLLLAARAQDRDQVTLYLYLPLVQASCSNSRALRWERCLHMRVVINVCVSTASVILVLRAKRHKGISVDSLPAEKKRPLLIFRFEPSDQHQ